MKNLLLAMVGVAAGFIVVLDIGFSISGDTKPWPIGELFYVAAVVLTGVAFVAARSLRRPRRAHGGTPAGWDISGANKRRWQRESRLLTDSTKQRLAALEADPATQKYARLIRGGQPWSDVQIAYDRNPVMLVTCDHLRPIERAMRVAGIQVRPNHGPHAQADCRIDTAELTRRFGMDLPLFYNDAYPGDRPFDPVSAVLTCREHESSIWVVHPDDAKPETPWFPRKD